MNFSSVSANHGKLSKISTTCCGDNDFISAKLPRKQNVVKSSPRSTKFCKWKLLFFLTYFCESKTSQDIYEILWVIIKKFLQIKTWRISSKILFPWNAVAKHLQINAIFVADNYIISAKYFHNSKTLHSRVQLAFLRKKLFKIWNFR